MDIEFNSLKELKKRIEPVLNTKIKELKNNYNIITKDDIWNYLKQTKWQNASNLTLYDIVNDIMNIDYKKIEQYAIKRSEKNDESKPKS